MTLLNESLLLVWIVRPTLTLRITTCSVSHIDLNVCNTYLSLLAYSCAFLSWQASLRQTVHSTDVRASTTALLSQMPTKVLKGFGNLIRFPVLHSPKVAMETCQLRIPEVPAWSQGRRQAGSRLFVFFISPAGRSPGWYTELGQNQSLILAFQIIIHCLFHH
jgi:hypothetical protein